MRVLFITCWFPTQEKRAYGAFVLEHARALQTAGAEVCIIHLDIDGGQEMLKIERTAEDLNGMQLRRIRIRSKRLWKFIYVSPNWLWKYFRTELTHEKMGFKPDLVHSNVIFPAGIAGHRAARLLQVPHVITEHWTGLNNFFRKHVARKAGLSAYQEAAAIFPVSNFLGQTVRVYSKNHEHIHMVPNVVDASTFSYQAKRTRAHFELVAIGNWNIGNRQIKLPELLLQGIANATAEKPIRIEIIGEGNMVPSLKALAIELGVEACFSGYQNKAYIAQKLTESDLFVHASSYETFGVVVAEALCTGTPAVVSNVAPLPDLIRPENGILTENTSEAWGQAITQALNKRWDHHKIAQEIGEKYNLLSVGQQFIYHYQNLL